MSTRPATTPAALLSASEAARRAGVSRYFVLLAIDDGRLPCWRTPGGQRRVRQADVDQAFALTASGR